MLSNSGIYRVRDLGDQLVVTFGDDGMPGHFFYPECRTDLTKVIEDLGCKVLVFDLAEETHLASGMIGLLTWLQRQGVEVRLRNVSELFRQTLHTLQLDNVLPVEAVPVEA